MTYLRTDSRGPLLILLGPLVVVVALCSTLVCQQSSEHNSPGVMEPVLSALHGSPVRIPNTDQAQGDQLLNLAGPVIERDAEGATSILGHTITDVSSPNDAMEEALTDLTFAAGVGNLAQMQAVASELRDILLGTTSGRIFDGFAMLN